MTNANEELSSERLDQVSGGTWVRHDPRSLPWWVAAARLEHAIRAQVKTTVDGSPFFPSLS